MESIVGGVIIGIAVSLMLLFNGRVVGISGIFGALLQPKTLDKNWRILFVMGLILGGIVLRYFYPIAFTFSAQAPSFDYVIAGFLVGVGTLLGNGCTSGHGVCGVSRLSIRSIAATMTFIVFGILGVLLLEIFRGSL